MRNLKLKIKFHFKTGQHGPGGQHGSGWTQGGLRLRKNPPAAIFKFLFCVCAAAPLLVPLLILSYHCSPSCALCPPLPLLLLHCSISSCLPIVLALSLSCMCVLGTNYFAVSSLCPFPLSRSHSSCALCLGFLSAATCCPLSSANLFCKRGFFVEAGSATSFVH